MKHYETKLFMIKQLTESLSRWGLSYWLTTCWDVPYPVAFEKDVDILRQHVLHSFFNVRTFIFEVQAIL
jgi:hypothetical protein